MMLLNRSLFILFFVINLMACATHQRMESHLIDGREQFARQNYYNAYKKLYPVAWRGDPEAQYAIAYLYYYGKGVLEDKEAAKRWMEKSALQGYSKADEALKQIIAQERKKKTYYEKKIRD